MPEDISMGFLRAPMTCSPPCLLKIAHYSSSFLITNSVLRHFDIKRWECFTWETEKSLGVLRPLFILYCGAFSATAGSVFLPVELSRGP